MRKFLVTGGAGFIGSHITETLLKKGDFVRVLDNFSSGKMSNLVFTKEIKRKSNFELVKGDIRNIDTCVKATKGIDFVLHQAALRSVPKSLERPHDYNDVNIDGTLNMLEAALKNRVRSFVLASSSSIYGDVDRFPEKEFFLPELISPYALSKLTGEHYCRIFSQHYGLPTASLRYFNVFGPRQAVDDEYAVVIPKFITCMLRDEHPPIFGTGKQSRDFTFVKNVVQANILASQKKGLKGEVFNVASGRDYTVLSLVAILNRLMGKNIKPLFLKPRAGDVFRTLADLTKSRKALKFCPEIDFTEGLKITLEYFKKNG
ncbi:MAG: SDR family oxidoreductase [Candidatus Omnitrophica bacterium]|nr:SDR family oxidoreductase [Candidatus Omnitrophota bacterium]MBU1869937.1 SDR family oxidoreductase [Candidatus Omnitrophota bacterium]